MKGTDNTLKRFEQAETVDNVDVTYIFSREISPNLDRVRNAASTSGFECMATEWNGWQTQYLFRCSSEHIVSRTAANVIFHGIVCKECHGTERLKQLQQIAQAKGGKCLETEYLGIHVHHRFVCAHGHEWKIRASNILNKNSWCRRCAQSAHAEFLVDKNGLSRLQLAAVERGGKCLTETYGRMRDYYRFECANGHQWEAEGAEIVRGSWCGECARLQKRIDYRLADGLQQMQEMAQSRGGECLSDTYLGQKARYRFRCKHGHEWETVGQKIFRGFWCRECTYNGKRDNIEHMRELAKARGGLCISTEYVNSLNKLEWECHLGHRWLSLPQNIKKGHWCPSCGFMSHIRNPNSKAMSKYIASPRHRFSKNTGLEIPHHMAVANEKAAKTG